MASFGRIEALAGVALAGVVGLSLAMEMGAPVTLQWASGALLLLYGAVLFRRMSLSAQGLILVAVALAGPALVQGWLGPEALRDALGRAGAIAALFACFGFLRDAAAASEGVRRCGRFLARRPPGQRYGALTLGGHLFGLILNFGAIPLLGTLTVEGTRAADRPDEDPARIRRDAIRRHRMAQAVHRGFIATLTWSPLTVSMAVIFSTVHGAQWRESAPWLAGTAGLFVGLGWLLDRFSPVRRTTGLAPDPDEGGSWALLLPVLGLVAAIFGAGVFLEEALDLRLVVAVMIVSPVAAALWMLAQSRVCRSWPGALAATGERLGRHVLETFPTYHTELMVVAASAFIGMVIAAVLPPDAVPSLLAALGWPAWVVLAVVPWLCVLGGQVGMSPVLSVSLLAATLPAPAVLGVPATAMVAAFSGSWALVAASSPFTAAVLTSTRVATSRARPTSPLRFGLRDNLSFTLLATLALSVYVAVLARG
ncbi:hypothetical protein [Pararhodospirillum photometricum]|nr:hypothetical protein [Pararhodospirillum photometricum]